MKKYTKYLLLLFFLFILFQFIINSNLYIDCVQNSIILWKDRILPTIFPFLLLSEFLINYDFIKILNILFGKIFKNFLNINDSIMYIFFMSLFSGFPSSAIYINDLYQKKQISYESANKALIICHFSNPLFIIGYIGSIMDIKYAYYILIIHYLSTFIIAFIFKKKNYDNNNIYFKPNSFGFVLKNGIKKGIDNCLLILGTIIFFNILNTTINQIELPLIIENFFNIFLELTNGIEYIINNYDLKYQCILITMLLSFGGLCVHLQVVSILEESKIKYQNYLFSRILQSLISAVLILLTFNLLFH